ncbi:methyltransferase domain-containing protein [Spirillospora sp. CA-142024]|uniref:methyltransferase domain-containing protein n=1 Tax=Spirillospora sp. CA-142024 TaxID=3240036 RepID=UPI003D8A26DE
MPTHDASSQATSEAIVARYSGLARLALAGGTPQDGDGCGNSCFGAAAYPADNQLPEAALRASIGCGNSLTVAELLPGETVLDLGSGGGLDVLLSARRVGSSGIAYGLDASDDMLTLARTNAAEAGAENARFLHGHIENVPLPDASVDVVISNCVINLAADKPRVLAEAFRVLRPGGRFGVSDIIAVLALQTDDLAAAEERVGCAVTALTAKAYRRHLLAAGFTAIAITPTAHAGDGLRAAIVQASKPAS